MYALVEVHDSNYTTLSDLTWVENKLEYAKLHGYKTFCRTDNDFVPNILIGFQKLYFIKELLENNPEIDWFWWTGCDAIVTNFGTRIEDRIDNRYHFIVAVDKNGLNADSFLIRNSPEGKKIINGLISLRESSSKFWDTDQRAMCTLFGFPGTSEVGWPEGENLKVINEYKDIVKLVPQRYMNSFNYQLYHYTDHRDKLGWDGNWQVGDWLIHWPATSLEYRIELYNFYKEYIIK
jgi:hypothetical protein